MFYLSEDGLSDLLLQQGVEPLHLRGHAGRPVHVCARRMIKGPLLLRQLRHRMKKNICTTRRFSTVNRKWSGEDKHRELVGKSHSQGRTHPQKPALTWRGTALIAFQSICEWEIILSKRVEAHTHKEIRVGQLQTGWSKDRGRWCFGSKRQSEIFLHFEFSDNFYSLNCKQARKNGAIRCSQLDPGTMLSKPARQWTAGLQPPCK